MRSIPVGLVIALALGTAGAAHAGLPYSCSPMVVRHVSVASNLSRMKIRGNFFDGAFDPLANGMRIEVQYEPEDAPGNAAFTANLPASGFRTQGNAIVYRDPLGSVNGITRVHLHTGSNGKRRIRIGRTTGAPMPAFNRGGPIRIGLQAGSCVRSCSADCRVVQVSRLLCNSGDDRTLCGIRSGCDLLNAYENQGTASSLCLLPYPSDYWQTPDPTTPTGWRHRYAAAAMPTNGVGVPVNPADWNVLDGFSPGTIVTAHFPMGVDAAASGVNTWQNYAPSTQATSPTLLIDADTCERVEHFAENDISIGAGALPVAPPRQVFMMRPGRRLQNAHRYLVAMRGLKAVGGGDIPPSPAFRALRDGTPTALPQVEARRAHMEQVFDDLAACGVQRNSLLLAWDFTTASDDAIQRWLLHMRDETFAGLGDSASPAFTISSVEDNPFPGDSPQRICRRVRGTFVAPLYMSADAPGSELLVNPMTNLPEQNGTANIPFVAAIPCSLANAPAAGRAIFYGHGLLGSSNEVTAGNLRTLANTYGFVIAATDWQGMSNADVGTVASLISDFSNFRKLPGRLHQGILNQLLLARLMKSPSGLASHAAFIYGGQPVIQTGEVFYDGNSQGGIFGGVVMALSQDATRGVLGVPGGNYSTLLQRSVDFDPFFALLRNAYPNDVDRAMTYPLIEELWQRAEPLGWYHRTTANPLPNTPVHKVLLHMATSDAEVSNVDTEIMARSMGMPQVAPVVKSYFGIPEMTAPFDGSALVESDGGYGPIPIGNIPPADNGAHGAMRGLPAIQQQKDAFLRSDGTVQNFCTGPCDPQ